MSLHIISQSPFQHQTPFQAISMVAPADCVVFTNDGVYALLHNDYFDKIKACKAKLFFLSSDATLRGVKIDQQPCTGISMDQFVDMVFQEKHTLNWDY